MKIVYDLGMKDRLRNIIWPNCGPPPGYSADDEKLYQFNGYNEPKRHNWGMTIFAYLVIAFFIAITVISAINSDQQPPLTPEQRQDLWENDPRW